MRFQAAMPILLLCFLAQPASAGEDLEELVRKLMAEVSELKSRARQSDARITELEKQLVESRAAHRQTLSPPASVKPPPASAAAKPAEPPPMPQKPEAKPPVTLGDVKGSFKIPGTDTSLGIGGYINLDAIYNSASAKGGANNYANLMLIPGAVPVESNRGNHGEIVFNARETRFWLKSFTPTAWGDLNTYLEMDFMTYQQPGTNPAPGDERTTNGYAPRLRQAFGTLGNFLAGQTYSTFMNVAALPETNDLGGPVGQIFVRQPLIRWTQPLGAGGVPLDFQASVENPETTLTLPNGIRDIPDDDQVPDMVVRLNYNPAWGSLSAAGLVRQIRYASDSSHEHSQEWGAAFSLAGRVRIALLDNIRFMFNYGDVLGRYSSYNLFNDGALNSTGRISLFKSLGGFLAYQHWWSQTWRSTVAYGYARADNPAFVADSISQQAQSVHVNLLWSPFLQTTIGLEYLYATRELDSGWHGDLQRVQFATRFSF